MVPAARLLFLLAATMCHGCCGRVLYVAHGPHNVPSGGTQGGDLVIVDGSVLEYLRAVSAAYDSVVVLGDGAGAQDGRSIAQWAAAAASDPLSVPLTIPAGALWQNLSDYRTALAPPTPALSIRGDYLEKFVGYTPGIPPPHTPEACSAWVPLWGAMQYIAMTDGVHPVVRTAHVFQAGVPDGESCAPWVAAESLAVLRTAAGRRWCFRPHPALLLRSYPETPVMQALLSGGRQQHDAEDECRGNPQMYCVASTSCAPPLWEATDFPLHRSSLPLAVTAMSSTGGAPVPGIDFQDLELHSNGAYDFWTPARQAAVVSDLAELLEEFTGVAVSLEVPPGNDTSAVPVDETPTDVLRKESNSSAPVEDPPTDSGEGNATSVDVVAFQIERMAEDRPNVNLTLVVRVVINWDAVNKHPNGRSSLLLNKTAGVMGRDVIEALGTDNGSVLLQRYRISGYELVDYTPPGSECPSGHNDCAAGQFCSRRCLTPARCANVSNTVGFCEPCDMCTPEVAQSGCDHCKDLECKVFVKGECAADEIGSIEVVLAGGVDEWTTQRQEGFLDDVAVAAQEHVTRDQLSSGGVVAGSVVMDVQVRVSRSQASSLSKITTAVVDSIHTSTSLHTKWGVEAVQSQFVNATSEPIDSPDDAETNGSGGGGLGYIWVILIIVAAVLCACAVFLWWFLLCRKNSQREQREAAEPVSGEPVRKAETMEIKVSDPVDNVEEDRAEEEEGEEDREGLGMTKPVGFDAPFVEGEPDQPTVEGLLRVPYRRVLDRYPLFAAHVSTFESRKQMGLEKNWTPEREEKMRKPITTWIDRGLFSSGREDTERVSHHPTSPVARGNGIVVDIENLDTSCLCIPVPPPSAYLRMDISMDEYAYSVEKDFARLIGQEMHCDPECIRVVEVIEGSVITKVEFTPYVARGTSDGDEEEQKMMVQDEMVNLFVEKMSRTHLSPSLSHLRITSCAKEPRGDDHWVPLTVFFKPPHDHWVVASVPARHSLAKSMGYTQIPFADLGRVRRTPYPGTVPLVSTFNQTLGDHMLVASKEGAEEASRAGYMPQGIEGYISIVGGSNLVPLELFARREHREPTEVQVMDRRNQCHVLSVRGGDLVYRQVSTEPASSPAHRDGELVAALQQKTRGDAGGLKISLVGGGQVKLTLCTVSALRTAAASLAVAADQCGIQHNLTEILDGITTPERGVCDHVALPTEAGLPPFMLGGGVEVGCEGGCGYVPQKVLGFVGKGQEGAGCTERMEETEMEGEVFELQTAATGEGDEEGEGSSGGMVERSPPSPAPPPVPHGAPPMEVLGRGWLGEPSPNQTPNSFASTPVQQLQTLNAVVGRGIPSSLSAAAAGGFAGGQPHSLSPPRQCGSPSSPARSFDNSESWRDPDEPCSTVRTASYADTEDPERQVAWGGVASSRGASGAGAPLTVNRLFFPPDTNSSHAVSVTPHFNPLPRSAQQHPWLSSHQRSSVHDTSNAYRADPFQ